MELLQVESLCRSFGAKAAVRDVTFTVRRGETVAFLGPNGAGKSTTLRMAAGVLEPGSGDVLIDGFSIVSKRIRAQARLGYLAEGAPLYGELPARDFLMFLARARGLTGRAASAAVADAAADTLITDVLARPIETLSKGYRRRVALAGALLHKPPVLILDEPTDGLDPNQKQAMRAMIERMRPDHAILISTHQLDEVQAMCTRAIVIASGQVVADETPAALAARDGGIEAAFRALTAPSRAEAA
jgi:ABC-2 type transport system ATP-binding protein